MHGENASLMYMKPNTLTKRDIVDTLPKLPMELLDLSPSVFDTALYIHPVFVQVQVKAVLKMYDSTVVSFQE